jgi:hypothetical protein
MAGSGDEQPERHVVRLCGDDRLVGIRQVETANSDARQREGESDRDIATPFPSGLLLWVKSTPAAEPLVAESMPAATCTQ